MIDLRSDTVTKPSQGMLQAMLTAPVGDDVYQDDPTVNDFEAEMAELFGKEAGLFTPTGSLSNQLCIKMLVKPGEELLTEVNAHIARAELGAGAVFSGITTRTWRDAGAPFSAASAMQDVAVGVGPYLVHTKAIALENTHNLNGGQIAPYAEIAKLDHQAHALGIATHLDGARIWNAHMATGVGLAEYAQHFDTVSICFSKGLGAPVGSMALGSQSLINEARIWRKRYGAGMRQIGLLAAAARYGVRHHLADLAADHQRAASFAEQIAAHFPDVVNPSSVATNIVIFDLAGAKLSAPELITGLKERGVLASAFGSNFARFVTHRDFTDADLKAAVAAVLTVLRA
jgi:threonine aldolase